MAQQFHFVGPAGGDTEADPLFPARAQAESPMGYLNAKGEWAVKPQYAEALPFSEGLAVVSDGARSAAIDRSGQIVVAWFDGLMYPFSHGLACVVPGGSIRLGMLGRIRQKLFGRPGEDAYAAPWWQLKGRVGFVDTTGAMAIQPRFELRLNFMTAGCGFSAMGYAAMRQDGKEGLIDTRGDWIVEPRHDYLGMVFSGNRKVVALIAEDRLDNGLFLDTIKRVDGSMVPGETVRWRETGATQEVVASGGLGRLLLNHLLFPRWQRELLNDDVSSRTLGAWVGSLVLGVAAAFAMFRRARSSGSVARVARVVVALLVGAATVAVSFLVGLVTLYGTAATLLAAGAMFAWKRLRS